MFNNKSENGTIKVQKRSVNIISLFIIMIIIIGSFIFIKQTNKSVDVRSINDSLEITNVPRIFDKANLYSVEVPETWQITNNKESNGINLSEITLESLDWKGRSDENFDGPCSPTYYESGVLFSIISYKDNEDFSHYGEGGNSETGVLSTKNITIDGMNSTYHVFKEPCTYEGLILDAHTNDRLGNGYVFRLIYNPDQYNQGETLFMNILNSVKFTQ